MAASINLRWTAILIATVFTASVFLFPAQNSLAATKLIVSTKMAKDPVVRGNIQTIYVKVIDSKSKPIKDAAINVIVGYASGTTTKTFSGKTDSKGGVSFSWRIGGDSKPGKFTIESKATKQGYDIGRSSTGFQVIAKSKK